MYQSLEQSLAALSTDHVDIWQIHNVDRTVLNEAEVVAEVFETVRQRGQVRFCGGSFYGTDFPLPGLGFKSL